MCQCHPCEIIMSSCHFTEGLWNLDAWNRYMWHPWPQANQQFQIIFHVDPVKPNDSLPPIIRTTASQSFLFQGKGSCEGSSLGSEKNRALWLLQHLASKNENGNGKQTDPDLSRSLHIINTSLDRRLLRSISESCWWGISIITLRCSTSNCTEW